MNKLTLDTSKKFTYDGEKHYGNQSDGDITYNVPKRAFSTDIHALRSAPKLSEMIEIVLPENGLEIKKARVIKFQITKIDKSKEGEIYGYHGVSIGAKVPCTIFIIND